MSRVQRPFDHADRVSGCRDGIHHGCHGGSAYLRPREGFQSQSISGQARVHCCDLERKYRLCTLIVALDMPLLARKNSTAGFSRIKVTRSKWMLPVCSDFLTKGVNFRLPPKAVAFQAPHRILSLSWVRMATMRPHIGRSGH
jgi:hypothetical protein